ncbi:MAG TPA: 3-deoxy-8-phosphooctulonate synthase [Myxococcota bacterium]|nr:3-deoxy-8-phosphooctulonate synthase [Myxococcota bacterium]
MNVVEAGGIKIGGGNPLVLIGGPCVIENEAHLLSVARQIQAGCMDLDVPYILKTSFDKANRTSIDSYRGPGISKGLEILGRVKSALGVPLLCDVHEISQVEAVAEVADIVQIPAFLCRQTDLVCAVAKTGKPVNVKKGQFLSPADIAGVIGKIEHCGNKAILLTERGSSFGYNNLVVDMRSLAIMRRLGYPVVFDATHSLQLPGGLGSSTGGQREFVPHLSRAAAAVGIDALFMEIHDDPDQASCDGPNMIALDDLPAVLSQVCAIDKLVKENRWIF